ncbi:MAG TPA: adenosine deaminase [Candidatus Polarisedimenticolia bacterium]|jgi:adenosine deaminase
MGSTDFIGRLRKIDLHIHLEGSLSRSTLAALAARHRLAVPPLRAFTGMGGFLKSFGAVCDLMVDPEDFERAANDLFEQARRGRVAHMEVLFSPQVFMRRGVPLDSILRGLTRARRRAMRRPGLSIVYIMDGVRQWGGDWFEQVVSSSAPYAGRGLAGIGVGGDESALPARAFARAFRAARDLGLRSTVHAGESAGPESVREALRHLAPDRIGHGIGAADDPRLVSELARRGLALEICPTSNVATGVVSSMSLHPVRKLLDAGVAVTLNSDDGAFFGTNVTRELRLASRSFSFTRDEILRVTLNAARAAFLPAAFRLRLERAIHRSVS